ncbi:hypothetical protein B0H99_102322 [Planomicrobium soli]|uniref:Uncharacterized protein n=1 Tax=Planomicrobium soli TaxID=1176648 RepID=A0A2P8H604_9BACL|nr:hypothetical protein [Planomicrobium soli]PSL41638.1 hypothetical protein B0H99_102322 [Planomicrobium soli]
MEIGRKKKDRSWIPEVIIEAWVILREITMLIPRVIVRIVKDVS